MTFYLYVNLFVFICFLQDYPNITGQICMCLGPT